MGCIFCNIASGEFPAKLAYEDDHVLAFYDINPVAPHHILVIPRRHIDSADAFSDEDAELVGRLLTTASKIARQEGFSDGGYRTVMNCNSDGGQTVYHVHLHLLGGRAMQWPPG